MNVLTNNTTTAWMATSSSKAPHTAHVLVRYEEEAFCSLAKAASSLLVTTAVDANQPATAPVRYYEEAVAAAMECFADIKKCVRTNAPIDKVPLMCPPKLCPDAINRKKMCAELQRDLKSAQSSKGTTSKAADASGTTAQLIDATTQLQSHTKPLAPSLTAEAVEEEPAAAAEVVVAARAMAHLAQDKADLVVVAGLAVDVTAAALARPPIWAPFDARMGPPTPISCLRASRSPFAQTGSISVVPAPRVTASATQCISI